MGIVKSGLVSYTPLFTMKTDYFDDNDSGDGQLQ